MGSSSKTSQARYQESKNPLSSENAESSVSLRHMFGVLEGDYDGYGMSTSILW
jgi:hypothetical protein